MLTKSLPARGAWIEIIKNAVTEFSMMSLPARGAWIEIDDPDPVRLVYYRSLPARGAWIEIQALSHSSAPIRVAPREGSVD